MVDAEGRGDSADFPVFAEIEAANLGVQFGRDHGEPPGTRDGSARAVEGATRFRGRRPYNATRPPGARSAIDPSPCQRGVCRAERRGGKSDPSRGRDTPVGDRDDRGDLPDCADGAGARRRSSQSGRPCDTPTSNTRGPDHTTRRSRRDGCSAGRFFGEAACPRRRRGIAFRLDTTVKPWHKETTGSVCRSIEVVTEGLEVSAPGPPQIVAAFSLRDARAIAQSEEAVDAAAAVDAQNASTAAWKSR